MSVRDRVHVADRNPKNAIRSGRTGWHGRDSPEMTAFAPALLLHFPGKGFKCGNAHV
jgi:hypothetical protein